MTKRSRIYFNHQKWQKVMGKILPIVDQMQLAQLKMQQHRGLSGRRINIEDLETEFNDQSNQLRKIFL